MDNVTIGFLGIAVFFVLIFVGMPIGFAMLLVGAVGTFFVLGWGPGLATLRSIPYRSMANYNLTTIPLFLFMGTICYHSGISRGLFNSAYNWLGHRRGGLAMATVGACAGFSAVSGSSMACAATMGKIALPEMKRYNYSDTLATGCVAAGGTMGVMIPPSVGFIIYGLIAEQSIGKLFMAGILPGISQALFYIAIIYVFCRINPNFGPPGPRTTFKQKISSLNETWMVVLLFGVVMGGLYFGIFSPTEGAGIGAFTALLIALLRNRLKGQDIMTSLLESVKTTCSIFIIVIGAMVLIVFFAVTTLPNELSTLMTSLAVNRYLVIAAIIVIYLILGCFMEGIGMALLTIPIFLPVILALGFDPIWFGVLQTRVTEVGMITPPVGLNVFIIKGLNKDMPLGTIFRGIIPFFIADLLNIALLVAFPIISLLIPGLMFTK